MIGDKKIIICPNCDGDGIDPETNEKCVDCNGKGKAEGIEVENK